MRKAIIILTAILAYLGAMAQNSNCSEFSINIGGGASSFQTKPTEGKEFWDWTGTAGFNYHFFFRPNWGIGTGTNFAIYNGSTSIDDYNKIQKTINMETGNALDFWVSSSKYKETQQAMMVTIPLMVQYQGVGKTAFYAALGGKIGIPVSAKSQSESNFTTKGYFPGINVTYNNLPEYGFVTDQGFPENKTDINLKTAIMASVELGVKWRLGKKASLYTGIYADYGLNDILDKKTADNTNLVVYQPNTPAQFAYNTAVNSYAKQIKPFAGGIMLRLAFGCRKSPSKEEELQVEEPIEYDDDEEAKRLSEEEAMHQRSAGLVAEMRRGPSRSAAEKEIQKPVERYTLSQTKLNSSQKKELDKKIALLQQESDIEIFIYGHTCNVGDDATNEKIGFERAQNAKAYLISKGIDAKRIIAISSKRDWEPLVPNKNEEYRRINRRVEIVVAE